MDSPIGKLVPSVSYGMERPAFIPYKLSAECPVVDGEFIDQLTGIAARAIQGLQRPFVDSGDSFEETVESQMNSLLLRMFVRKEAVLSSQIEGTQTTLPELLVAEADDKNANEDQIETLTYVRALEYGYDQIADGFPISVRLVKEIHRILMLQARGANKRPGEFRDNEVEAGSFIPPPANEIADLFSDLEKYANTSNDPPIIKAAVTHYQFETIHPFFDGNGRVGRMIATLMLDAPLLYLSLSLKADRAKYFQALTDLRFTGNWNAWIGFFVQSVIDSAQHAHELSSAILRQILADVKKCANSGEVSVLNALLQTPVMSGTAISKAANTTPATTNKALDVLTANGIVQEITGSKRGRVYAWKSLLDVVEGRSK